MKELIRKKMKDNKKIIVPYLTFGFPTIKESAKIITKISEVADIIEIGVPFSDPLADGATIQKASKIALNNSVTLPMILETMSGLKKQIKSRLILMSYLNPCYRYGIKKLRKDLKMAGFEALIFPDLPYSEWPELTTMMESYDLKIVHLLSPTTPLTRAKQIMDNSSPFTIR